MNILVVFLSSSRFIRVSTLNYATNASLRTLAISSSSNCFTITRYIFLCSNNPTASLGRLIVEASRSHTHTHTPLPPPPPPPPPPPQSPHSVRLLWTSDQLVEEAAIWQTEETNIHAPGGFEPAVPSIERFQTYNTRPPELAKKYGRLKASLRAKERKTYLRNCKNSIIF